MIVLGIDAAASSGWAIVDASGGRPQLLDYGIAKCSDYRTLPAVVGVAITAGVASAAIEVPYVDKNIDTAIKLGFVVGRWMQELDRAALSYGTFQAQSWQHFILAGLVTPQSTREARKRAAISWVEITYRVRVPSDSADAICLATWRAKVLRVRGGV